MVLTVERISEFGLQVTSIKNSDFFLISLEKTLQVRSSVLKPRFKYTKHKGVFKMKTTKILSLIFLVILSLNFISCAGITPQPLPDPNPPVNNGKYTAYFWLTAIQDAHITSQIPDMKNSGGFSLVSAHGAPNGEQRIYLQFFMPQLPAGTVVKEAYFNVWEDSQTGQPGFSGINLATAQGPWDASTLTWNNQSNPVGPTSVGTGLGTYTTLNIWKGTGNISNIVQQKLDNPSTDYGWLLDNSAASAYTRSFRSMNAPQARTATTLGTAPRLLIKVESPSPINTSSIGTSITGPTELGTTFGFGTNILVYQVASGSNGWPASWDVAVGQ
jgi:hypothetical protein